MAQTALNELLAQTDILTLVIVFAEHSDDERAHGSVLAYIANGDTYESALVDYSG